MRTRLRLWIPIPIIVIGTMAMMLFQPVRAYADIVITDGMEASGVIGQPDLTSPARPLGLVTLQQLYPHIYAAPSSTNLADASRMYYDALQRQLFVADRVFHRVVVYDASQGLGDMPVVAVLGQPNRTSGGANAQVPANGCVTAVNACGMSTPTAVIVLTLGGTKYVAVSDSANRRVLFFDASDGLSDGEAAVNVLGQPNLTSALNIFDCYGGATTAASGCGLFAPGGLTFDPTHATLLVSASYRIAIFDLSSGIVDGMGMAKVLGQPDFVSNAIPNHCFGSSYSVDACSLNNAGDTLWDAASGLLYVASGNRGTTSNPLYAGRIAVFQYAPGGDLAQMVSNGEPAAWVIGQPDDYTLVRHNGGGSFLDTPMHITSDPAAQRLFVADYHQCRVVTYDVSGGAQAATAYGAVPEHVIGWPSLAAGGRAELPLFACGRAESVSGGAMNYSLQATPSSIGGSVSGILYIPELETLLVSDAYNGRIMVFGSTVDGVPVETVGGTSTATLNPDGTTTVSASSDGGNDFIVTFPDGTGGGSSGSVVITMGDGGGGTHPSVIIDASLPPGTAKSVTLPYYSSDLCVNDVPNATITTQGTCVGVRIKKADLPAAGNCVIWEESDTICRSSDGSTYVVNGLEHSALFYMTDGDGDGYADGEDLCPGTDLSGPVPTTSLRPNHSGDADVHYGGCNCSQILECKPGADAGEIKFGCTPGTLNVWYSGESWAASCQ